LACLFADSRVVAVEADPDSAAVCRRNLGVFGDRCRVLEAAVWGSDGLVGYGGPSAWDRSVVNLGAYPGVAAPAAAGTAEAVNVLTVLDRLGVEHADYLLMDIAGSEAAVFDSGAKPLRWLGGGRIGCIRVRVSPPSDADLAAYWMREAGMIAAITTGLDGRVIVDGMTRAVAGGRPRYPKPEDRIDPGPGPW
jgi:FkbM family methyltransferase